MNRAWVSLLLLLSTGALAQISLSAPVAVTPSVAREGQSQPRAAASASGFFVVWQAGVGRNSKIRGARVGFDGVSLDASGITIAEGAGGRFEPGVTFGHGVWFVVWSDLRSGVHAVYGTRVGTDGTVLDPGGILLSSDPNARMADVVATPFGFLVAYGQETPDGPGTVARARKLDTAGVPMAAPIALSTATPFTGGEDLGQQVLARSMAQQVRITTEGAYAYIVWEGNPRRMQAVAVSRAVIDLATGNMLGTPGFALPAVNARIHDPVLAGLGDGGILLSWTDLHTRGESGFDHDNAAIVPAWPSDGGVVRLVTFTPDGGSRETLRPSVSAAGVVAFVEGVENPQRNRRQEWRLRVRRILPDGSSPGADATVPGQNAWPCLVTSPSGVTLLLSTMVNDSGADAARLMTRVVTIQ